MRKGRTVAVVQARMQSTRLPGKVLKEILEQPLIGYLIQRLKRSQRIDQIVIATSTEPADDLIAQYCQHHAVAFFRGSEVDVLARYFDSAKAYNADFIVRVCADSPLIDPVLVDELVEEFLQAQPECDYLSNTINQSCPLGMNAEVFTFQALEQANAKANHPYDREHVTPYLYRHPELFQISEKHYSPDLGSVRLTVDTPEDFELVRLILEGLLVARKEFGLPEIMEFLYEHPELMKINAHIQQTPLVAKHD